jgi:ACR3 family arsenite efflux pump ArsB
VYAVLQIIGSVALGWVLFSSSLYTDAPPVAAIVIPVFPALIGCIYPVLIFVVLRRRADRDHVPVSVA